jgi:hypothetical protein
MRRAPSWKVLLPFASMCLLALASGEGVARANPTAEAGGERADRPRGETDNAPQTRLARGETLRYPQEADLAGGHYVGGVSYTVVDGPTAAITALCEDASAWRTFLPHVTGVRVVERRSDEDLLVEITQGNALVDATYTLHVRLDLALGEARFWMVRGRPHDIADAWGYFRFTPLDVATRTTPARTLVTVGVLVDVGEGWMRSLVEPKVQTAVLGVSDRVRDYVRYALR